jgi:hypothetical protein
MSETGFESEGAFGQWIQSTSQLHGALHFAWVRTMNDDHGLGNQFANIDNYMFWKMHGWIDKVWDRYRAAKGKKPTDQDIKDAVLAQCRQMDKLAIIVKPSLADPNACTPAPRRRASSSSTIRTIFEGSVNKCTGCHGPTGPHANLTLGGSNCIKSSDIVTALVNKRHHRWPVQADRARQRGQELALLESNRQGCHGRLHGDRNRHVHD